MKITHKNHNQNGVKNDNHIAHRLEELRRETAELERRLARGTGDLTLQAQAVSLAARIEAALRERPHSIDDLARELHASAGKVSAALRGMRKRLHNVGTEHDPAWFWIVGDDATAQEINAAVKALVRYRPMKFAELMSATGARYGRVSGAMVALRRDPSVTVINVDADNPLRARWYIVPDDVKPARLAR